MGMDLALSQINVYASNVHKTEVFGSSFSSSRCETSFVRYMLPQLCVYVFILAEARWRFCIRSAAALWADTGARVLGWSFFFVV